MNKENGRCFRCDHLHNSANICEFHCIICMNEFFKDVLEEDEYLEVVSDDEELTASPSWEIDSGGMDHLR